MPILLLLILGLTPLRVQDDAAVLRSEDSTAIRALLQKRSDEKKPSTALMKELPLLAQSSDPTIAHLALDLFAAWSKELTATAKELLASSDSRLTIATLNTVSRAKLGEYADEVLARTVDSDPGVEEQAHRTLFEIATPKTDAAIRRACDERHAAYEKAKAAKDEALAELCARRRATSVYYLAQRRHADAEALLVRELDSGYEYGLRVAIANLSSLYPLRFRALARTRIPTAERPAAARLLAALNRIGERPDDRQLGFDRLKAGRPKDDPTVALLGTLLERHRRWLGPVVPESNLEDFRYDLVLFRSKPPFERRFARIYDAVNGDTAAFRAITLDLPLAQALFDPEDFEFRLDGRKLEVRSRSESSVSATFGIGSASIGLWLARKTLGVSSFSVLLTAENDIESIESFDKTGRRVYLCKFSSWNVLKTAPPCSYPLACDIETSDDRLHAEFQMQQGAWLLHSATFSSPSPEDRSKRMEKARAVVENVSAAYGR